MTAPETPLATRGWAIKTPAGKIDMSSATENRNDIAYAEWAGQTVVPVEIRELPAEKEKD